ncbi:MAG TPA: hypothetical protein VGH79_04220 [Gaiellaceae bacterium]|jgi:hypothetical protein
MNGVTRRFVMAGAIAAVGTAVFLPASGFGSTAASVRRVQAAIPPALAKAIHARLGAGAIRSGAAATAAASGGIDPNLGLAVSLSASGTTALVGAPGVDGYRGAAYIFHASDAGSWTSKSIPTATLTSKHGSAMGFFGLTVALSADGTTAFVGAPLNGGVLFGPGAIYVFHTSSEDAWHSTSTPAATLTVNHSVWLGIAFAASPDGTALVVGAPFFDSSAGGAYIFHASSESAWATTSSPTATLSNAAQSLDDSGAGFATAISADGATVLVSDTGNQSGGGAYLFHASAEDAWAPSTTPTAILSDSGAASNDFLGGALALSADGTVALLGSPDGSNETGYVDLFHPIGDWTSTSTPTAKLTNSAGQQGNYFGENLAIAPDGKTVLVLAPGASSARGAGYIFNALSESLWISSGTPAAILTNSAGKVSDQLGIGAFSGDGATVLLGAPGVDKGTGAGEIFHATDESSWATSASPSAILTDKKLAACVVPRLKGLKLAAAKHALAVGRCRLGKVGKVPAPAKRLRARVVSQGKKAGKRLAIDAKVNVKVGK